MTVHKPGVHMAHVCGYSGSCYCCSPGASHAAIVGSNAILAKSQCYSADAKSQWRCLNKDGFIGTIGTPKVTVIRTPRAGSASHDHMRMQRSVCYGRIALKRSPLHLYCIPLYRPWRPTLVQLNHISQLGTAVKTVYSRTATRSVV